MGDYRVEKPLEQDVFCREIIDTEQRVRAAFLYYAGLSYRRVKAVVDYSKGCRLVVFAAGVPLRPGTRPPRDY